MAANVAKMASEGFVERYFAEVWAALAGKAGLAANNTFTGNNKFDGSSEFNGSEEHNGAVNFLKIPTLKSDNTDRMAVAFPVYVDNSGLYYLVPHVTVQDDNTATMLVDSYDITSAYVRDLLLQGNSGFPSNWYVRIELNCTNGSIDANGNLEPVDYIPVRYYDAAAGDYVDGYVNPNIYIEASSGGTWANWAISLMSPGGSYSDSLNFQFDLLDAGHNVVGSYQAAFELTQDDYPTYSPPNADDSNGYHAVCNYSYAYFIDGSSWLDSTLGWMAVSTAGTGYVPTKNTRVASESEVAAAEARINNTLSSYPTYSYLSSNYVPRTLTASTSRAGIVQLSSATNGSSDTKAATEKAVGDALKTAARKYNSVLNARESSMTVQLRFSSGAVAYADLSEVRVTAWILNAPYVADSDKLAQGWLLLKNNKSYTVEWPSSKRLIPLDGTAFSSGKISAAAGTTLFTFLEVQKNVFTVTSVSVPQ